MLLARHKCVRDFPVALQLGSSSVARPLLIMLELKLLFTRASLIDFFKHRRKCTVAWRNASERRNYSPGLSLKRINFEGLMVKAVNEIFVHLLSAERGAAVLTRDCPRHDLRRR